MGARSHCAELPELLRSPGERIRTRLRGQGRTCAKRKRALREPQSSWRVASSSRAAAPRSMAVSRALPRGAAFARRPAFRDGACPWSSTHGGSVHRLRIGFARSGAGPGRRHGCVGSACRPLPHLAGSLGVWGASARQRRVAGATRCRFGPGRVAGSGGGFATARAWTRCCFPLVDEAWYRTLHRLVAALPGTIRVAATSVHPHFCVFFGSVWGPARRATRRLP